MTAQHNQDIKILTKEIIRFENQQLERILSKLNNCYCLLQLSQTALSKDPCIKYSIVVSTIKNFFNAKDDLRLEIEASYFSLPFPDKSIDVVLLLHILESEQQAERIFAEAWRILSPNGYLIFIGFNPWCLYRFCHSIRFTQNDLFSNKFLYSAGTVRRWIHQLNGEIKSTDFFFFRPLINQKDLLKKLSWIEKILPSWLSFFGNIYLILAQKRVIPLIPITMKENWSDALSKSKTLIPVVERLK